MPPLHVKLGKKAAVVDPRSLKLAVYTAALAPPPVICNLTVKISKLGPMLNLVRGCCTIAGIGHLIQAITAEADREFIVPDDVIEQRYIDWCGYVEGDPSTDQGGVELDVLKAWRKDGIAGHYCGAFAVLSKRRKSIFSFNSWKHDVKNAVYYFGAAYIGVDLPLSAQNVDKWEVVSSRGDGAPGSWGGHCVPIVAYDDEGVTVISWGEYIHVSYDFLDMYCDEAYCIITEDVLTAEGKSPQGFALAQLQADLNLVTL